MRSQPINGTWTNCPPLPETDFCLTFSCQPDWRIQTRPSDPDPQLHSSLDLCSSLWSLSTWCTAQFPSALQTCSKPICPVTHTHPASCPSQGGKSLVKRFSKVWNGKHVENLTLSRSNSGFFKMSHFSWLKAGTERFSPGAAPAAPWRGGAAAAGSGADSGAPPALRPHRPRRNRRNSEGVREGKALGDRGSREGLPGEGPHPPPPGARRSPLWAARGRSAAPAPAPAPRRPPWQRGARGRCQGGRPPPAGGESRRTRRRRGAAAAALYSPHKRQEAAEGREHPTAPALPVVPGPQRGARGLNCSTWLYPPP